ncbi:hypothetical protein tb265_15260 [Gemmatimonadetes bacterium T265]|nr:hypothetical protein tb265_15260 [Gemmatimonadetes bacterium T265]
MAERLRGTRRRLRAVVLARAVLWVAAALTLCALAGALAQRVGWLPPRGLVIAAAGAIVAAGIAAVARPWRAWTLAAVALWIEARVPALRYALVTLADAGPTAAVLPAPVARLLADRVRAVRWDDVLRDAARRALVRPAAVLVAAAGLLVAAHRAPGIGGRERGAPVSVGNAPAGTAAPGPAADPLAHVRATVTPPAYARQPARTLDDPPAITALVGSSLVIDGAGDAARVRASIIAAPGGPVANGSASTPLTAAPTAVPLAVRAAGGRWRVALAMPGAPTALRLAGPVRDRVVVLDPRPDLPPRVALLAPTRDTVVRAAQGVVALRARAADDLGLVDGAFEYVVSSGEGENFTFRTGRVGAAHFGGTASGALGASLDLATLALKPGDLVHVRALARDARPGAAPGSSETRAIRVARAGEYDSIAVEGAPPPEADTSALGQRMLLQLTEALVARADARRAPLPRPEVVAESRRIGGDQARLRRRVGDAVFSRLGGHASGEESQGSDDASERRGRLTPQELLAEANRATGAGAGGALEGDEAEAPVTAVNKPLLEAYNAMWDAGRALEVGEPRGALAPMRRAIVALERARQAERIYLRGRPPVVVVDLAKVRGAGHVRGDTLHPAPRDLGSGALYAPIDPAARARAAALDRALAALAGGPAARAGAADSLALLRVAALGTAPALAAALGDALAALARGGDATAPLARARRAALGPAAPAGPGAGAWAGGWQDLRP